MKGESKHMEKMLGDVSLGLKVAEIVTRPVIEFTKEVVVPDELKQKEKPVRRSGESLEDLMRVAAIRAELEALSKPVVSSAVTQTSI